MDLRIADNIRAFRKARHMTQEQLAQAMGVSIGAVSKWEQGSSAPDLLLIVELARFFEISVDVLLGHAWEQGSMGTAAQQLLEYGRNKNYDEGLALANRSLQKYPNSFLIVYRSASLYFRLGWERGDNDAKRRSLELFERALTLVGQDPDEGVHELSIRNSIAELHLLLGETERGLEELKRNNVGYINNVHIGMILVNQYGRNEEAFKYLSEALWDNALSVVTTCIAFCNVFAREARYGEALSLLGTTRAFIEALQKPRQVSYLLKTDVMLLTALAVICVQSGQEGDAKPYLEAAYREAVRFDANPTFGSEGVRYICELSQASAGDDFGQTALEGIEKAVADNDGDAKGLRSIWETVKEEANEK